LRNEATSVRTLIQHGQSPGEWKRSRKCKEKMLRIKTMFQLNSTEFVAQGQTERELMTREKT
jgi:hypothetical protein